VVGLFNYRWLIPVGAVLLVCAALLLPGTVRAVSNRFGDLSSRSANHATSSWTWRTGQWRRMLPYGLNHPLTGMGFGSYEATTVREFGYEDHTYPTLADPSHPDTSAKGFTAHNDYVRMIVELGIPGLLLWSAVLLGLLASVIRAARVPAVRPLAVGTAAVLVALIGASFSDNVQGYTMDLLLPLVLAGGLATVARRERAGRRVRPAGPPEDPAA
jgi:O-antigen ligase